MTMLVAYTLFSSKQTQIVAQNLADLASLFTCLRLDKPTIVFNVVHCTDIKHQTSDASVQSVVSEANHASIKIAVNALVLEPLTEDCVRLHPPTDVTIFQVVSTHRE